MATKASDVSARAAMAEQEELGNSQLDSLPLADKPGRHPSYQPSRRKIVPNADSVRLSSKWKKTINAGGFNDSDAAAVRSLDDLGGPRQHDKHARRLDVRPPPPPCAVSPPTSSITGQASHPIAPVPPASSTRGVSVSQQLASDGKAQAGTGRDNLPVPAPSRGGKVNVPLTPAASPTAPIAGVSAAKPTPAEGPAAAPVSPPKPDRGLRASRWATNDDKLNPTTNGRNHEPEVSPLGAKAIERQATPNPCAPDSQIRETTQALLGFKISDDDRKTKIDPRCIDPMTGKFLGQDCVISGEAWLSVDAPDRKRYCGLYLRVQNQTYPVFEVVVPRERKATHNLLDMLCQCQSGAFLDLAFRLSGNRIMRYILELGTEEEASELLEGMEDLRELTLQALSDEMMKLVDASSAGIIAKRNAKLGFTSATTITTVTYPFPAPTRKTRRVNSEPMCTDTVQGVLIQQADGPSPKLQRRTYTQDELTSLRNEESNVPLFQIDDDFIRTVKEKSHKRTDSKECVVGVAAEEGSRSAVVVPSHPPPSAVLGNLRQMMSDDRTWVSREGETEL